ncbi:MAG: UbiD family decarboxylase [Candidatus Thermoplasmatota archaeon]
MSLKEIIKTSDSEVVEEKVDTEFRVTQEGKKQPETPIYFPNFPQGPLVTNLWASRSRLADHFNIEKGEIIDVLASAVDDPSEPVKVDKGAFEEEIEENVDLKKLPIPKYYPKDGGRYITSGIVIAECDGIRNLSYHRMMLRDEETFTIRICPRHLKKMYDRALKKKDHLEIAVVIGVNPAVLLAASTSIDYGIDELRVANSLREKTLGKKVELTELDNGLLVPAEAEYALQGRITSQKDKEGPFVDITGTYDRMREQPIVEIDRVCRRKDAVFHGLLPGGNEHFLLMGLPRESVLKRELNKVAEVKDVRLTEGGCSWLHGVISVESEVEKSDVEDIIENAFKAHGSMKKVTVVDGDIDIYDDKEIEWAVATRFQPDEDIYVFKEEKGSSLDPSAPDLTAKWGLNATRPWESEDFKKAEL